MIGRITTAGAITQYAVPTARYLQGITTGSRGNSFVAIGQTSRKLAVAKVIIAARLIATPSVVTAGSQMTVQGIWF